MGGEQSTQLSMPNEKKRFFAVEGNICVGKSELCSKAAQHGWNIMAEHVNRKLLRLFYEDSERYAFSMQMSMIQRRLYHVELHTQMTKYNDYIGCGNVADRSPLGDCMFALCNFLLEKITTREMQTYEDELGSSMDNLSSFEFLKQLDALIFLDDSPECCKERAEIVRGNAEELKIPLHYYECIDDAYFYMIRCILNDPSASNKLIVFRWGQYDEWQAVEAAVHQKQQQVHKCYNDMGCLVYKDDAIVKRDYQRYCLDNEKIDHSLNVIFKANIMNRSNPSSLDNKDETYCRYRKLVWQKQNEYKRLVMFYLSKGRHVSFE